MNRGGLPAYRGGKGIGCAIRACFLIDKTDRTKLSGGLLYIKYLILGKYSRAAAFSTGFSRLLLQWLILCYCVIRHFASWGRGDASLLFLEPTMRACFNNVVLPLQSVLFPCSSNNLEVYDSILYLLRIHQKKEFLLFSLDASQASGR